MFKKNRLFAGFMSLILMSSICAGNVNVASASDSEVISSKTVSVSEESSEKSTVSNISEQKSKEVVIVKDEQEFDSFKGLKKYSKSSFQSAFFSGWRSNTRDFIFYSYTRNYFTRI